MDNQSRRIPGLSFRSSLLSAVSLVVTFHFCASGQNTQSPTATTVSALPDACRARLARYEGTSVAEAYVARLDAVEKCSRQLVTHLNAYCQKQLGAMLDDVLGDVAPAPHVPDANYSKPPGAVATLTQFEAGLPEAIDWEEFAADDRSGLRKCLDDVVRNACERIERASRPLLAGSERTRRSARELSLVPALVALPDANWSVERALALPEWVLHTEKDKSQPGKETAMDFALRVGRPTTALAIHAAGLPKEPSLTDAVEYLRSASDRLREQGLYSQATACLREAGVRARDAKDIELTAQLHLDLARHFAELEDLPSAIAQVKAILETLPHTKAAPDAAVLNLKYLFDGQAYEATIEQAKEFRDLPACKPVLAKVIYAQWLSNIRLYRYDVAKKLQDEFLSQYQDHALAPEMYYYLLCNAIAHGDVEAATSHIDTITERYPGARVIRPAKRIQDLIAKEKDLLDKREKNLE